VRERREDARAGRVLAPDVVHALEDVSETLSRSADRLRELGLTYPTLAVLGLWHLRMRIHRLRCRGGLTIAQAAHIAAAATGVRLEVASADRGRNLAASRAALRALHDVRQALREVGA
jgi:hypothetical protein